MVGPTVGSGGVWSQAAGFVLVLLAVALKRFPRFIYVINKFYKLCNPNMICKDNAEINSITFQHKKG
jgi:hypothetical protein